MTCPTASALAVYLTLRDAPWADVYRYFEESK